MNVLKEEEKVKLLELAYKMEYEPIEISDNEISENESLGYFESTEEEYETEEIDSEDDN